MNLEKRLQSAANELNQAAARTAPPALGTAADRVRPWLAFAAAFVVVLAVFGIPYALNNFGQGVPPDGSPLAGAGFTSTTVCVVAETTTTVVGEGDVVSTPAPTTEASEAPAEDPEAGTTGCSESGETTTITEIDPDTPPGQMCGAAEQGPPTTVANGDPTYDLTEPVAEKLTAMAAAAATCDAAALAALAATDITTTFGADGGPEDIASWPADDERFTLINDLFNTTHGVTEMPDGSALYVWPAAFVYDTWDEIPAPAMDELLRIYTQEELDQISGLGSYGGWRIGITEAGEWIFFVAGD